MTIPSTTLTDGSITRPYEQGHCRIDEHVEVAYDSDIGTALSVLRNSTRGIDGIREEPEPGTGVHELGDDAVILRTRYWVGNQKEEMLQVRSAFARAVKGNLEAAGIEISPASNRDLESRIQVDEGTSQ